MSPVPFRLGKAYEGMDLNDQAITAYQKALALHPNHFNSLVNLGNQYLKAGKLDRAEVVTKKALKIMPNASKALFNMGQIKERQNSLDEAVKYYRLCVQIQPNFGAAFNQLGLIAAKEKNLKKAVDYYRKGLHANKEMAVLHVNIAIAYYLQKQYALCRKHALIGKKLNIPQAQRILNELNKLAVQSRFHRRDKHNRRNPRKLPGLSRGYIRNVNSSKAE